jgi:hypothetical protein
MRNEIYTRSGELSKEQQRVLLSFFELLHVTLPQSWAMTKLLQELIDNFVYIVRSEDYLLAVLDEYPATAESWSMSCSHGAADEGYTCGLWELFHAMSVGYVVRNKNELRLCFSMSLVEILQICLHHKHLVYDWSSSYFSIIHCWQCCRLQQSHFGSGKNPHYRESCPHTAQLH